MPAAVASPARAGVFISHAHEDQHLAQALRRLLEVALDLRPESITCTSDPEYDLPEGADIREQIGRRLEGAKVFVLLATPTSRNKEWVQYECGYSVQASDRGEMQFYILVASPLHMTSVPEPYRGRVVVTLKDGPHLHAFLDELRLKYGLPRLALSDDYTPALLELQRRCSDLYESELRSQLAGLIERHASDLQEQARTHRLEAADLAQESRGLRMQVKRLRWSAAATLMVAGAAWAWQVSSLDEDYRRELATRDQTIVDLSEQMKTNNAMVEQARINELLSLPLSGLFRDSRDRIVPCADVEATVPARASDGPKRKQCDDSGSFTFTGTDLQADYWDPINLTVRTRRGETYEMPIVRATAKVAIHIHAQGGS